MTSQCQACLRSCLASPSDSPESVTSASLLLAFLYSGPAPGAALATLLSRLALPQQRTDGTATGSDPADSATRAVQSTLQRLSLDEGPSSDLAWIRAVADSAEPSACLGAAAGIVKGAVGAAGSDQIPLTAWQGPGLDDLARRLATPSSLAESRSPAWHEVRLTCSCPGHSGINGCACCGASGRLTDP